MAARRTPRLLRQRLELPVEIVVARRDGRPTRRRGRQLSFDADALLPEDYVADVGVRLSLHKRFSGASSIDEVQDLATEMEDRFGPPPIEARRFVHLMRLSNLFYAVFNLPKNRVEMVR
jgi:transcription-repair coupling factor (superfamily II helicase)